LNETARLHHASRRRGVRWEGSEALTPGKHTIVYDFKYENQRTTLAAAGTIAWQQQQANYQRMGDQGMRMIRGY
jgi:hypothetical protein